MWAAAAGLTGNDILVRCRCGRWRPLFRGAYLVDADMYETVPRAAMIRAAVLSIGPLAAADVVVWERKLDAVAVLDSALHRRSLTEADLPEVLALTIGRPGSLAARRHLALVDGRSESQLESRLRLVLADGAVPAEEIQHDIRDRHGRPVAVADFAWPSARVLWPRPTASSRTAPRWRCCETGTARTP